MQNSLEKRLLTLESKRKELKKVNQSNDSAYKQTILSALNSLSPSDIPLTMEDIDWDDMEPASNEELLKWTSLKTTDTSFS